MAAAASWLCQEIAGWYVREVFTVFNDLSYLFARRHLRLWLVCGASLFLSANALPAQVISESNGVSSLSFGKVNFCQAGKTTPAPCSSTSTAIYFVDQGGILGIPRLVTAGQPDLDFALASGSTCIGKVSAGRSCVLNLTFTPKAVGGRLGAIEITNASGEVLHTTFLSGVGVGPQIAFTPASLMSLPCCGNGPTQAAVDSLGNVFVTGTEVNPTTQITTGLVEELPAGGGDPIKLPFMDGPGQHPSQVAVDGAGDVFVADPVNGEVVELPGPGGPPVTVLSSDTIADYPGALLVDGGGYLYVGLADNTEVLRIQPECLLGTSYCEATLSGYPPEFALEPPAEASNYGTDLIGDFFYINVNRRDGLGIGVSVEGPAVDGLQVIIDNLLGETGLVVDGLSNIFIVQDKKAIYETYPEPANPGVIEYSGTLVTSNTVVDSSIAVGPAGDFFLGSKSSVLELQRSQAPRIAFNTTAFGSTTTEPLTITNTGNAALVISPVIGGPSFKIVDSEPEGCMQGTPRGGACTLSIEFSPFVVGHHDDTLTIYNNGATTPVGKLVGDSTGVGTEREVPLSFKSIPEGTTKVLPLTIVNVGVSEKVTLETSIDGPSFRVLDTAANTCKSGVTAGNTCTLPVEFSPVGVGVYHNLLTLTPSGAAPSVVQLHGVGITAQP